MLEKGQQLKVFRSGRGTFIITVSKVNKWNSIEAYDGRGGFYTYLNEWIWMGPRGEEYYTLDDNGNIKSPKIRELHTYEVETIQDGKGWPQD